MRLGPVAAAVVAALCAIVFGFAPRADLLATIDVAAPPSRVWAVLADGDRYSEWNPTIAALRGELKPGAVIENVEGYGDDQMTFRPTVSVATPDRELRWRGHLWGTRGLFDAEHYFLLQAASGGTRFVQGEHLGGALLWVFDTAGLIGGFEAMNAALKARAEQAEAASAGR